MSNIVIYHNNLCPDIWDENYNLNSGIRLNLLKIAKDFYEKTKFEAPILDIYFMGSMASFNWNVESDIDVHVVIDLKSLKMPEETSEKMAKLVGSQWNSEHDILIKGHKVEMNIQSLTAEKPYVNGIYSLVKNLWIKRPSKQNPNAIDTPSIQLKYNGMKKYILDMIATGDREKLKAAKDYIDAFRQYGLDNDGELSIENITYKLLRTKGIIQQLKDAISNIYDKQLSIDEVTQTNLKQRHPTYVGDDLSQLTLDNLNALKNKSVRFYNAAKKSENQEMCNQAVKDYIVYRNEIKRRLEIINRPINEAGYNDTMTDDEKYDLANSYFDIGHDEDTGDDEGEPPATSYCWIWDGSKIIAKKDTTHGMAFSHGVASLNFKGRYDMGKDKILIVFPDHELRKLGNKRPTVDDIPTNVFNKLISKFGKNNQFVVFENKLNESTDVNYDACADFLERKDSQLYEIANFLKSNKTGNITWKTISATLLKKTWLLFGKYNKVNDNAIDKIADQLLTNIVRLTLANEFTGHSEEYHLREIIDDSCGIEFTDEEWENVCNRFEDKNGRDYISDYGIRPLQRIYSIIFNAKTPEEKLYACDKALNVVHQRSDLAAMFVEGGQTTLTQIANQGGYNAGYEYGQMNREFREHLLNEAITPPQSPEFKRWFGNSKVVDNAGNPLVVYHGTNQPISTFSKKRLGISTQSQSSKKAYFFTDSSEVAAEYAAKAGRTIRSGISDYEKKIKKLQQLVDKLETRAKITGNWEPYEKAMEKYENYDIGTSREDEITGQNILPVFLKIENPLIYDYEGNLASPPYKGIVELIDTAIKNGNDGVILKNINDPTPISNHYIVFKSNQIKSAIGNVGTFNHKHSSITKEQLNEKVGWHGAYQAILLSTPSKLIFADKNEDTHVSIFRRIFKDEMEALMHQLENMGYGDSDDPECEYPAANRLAEKYNVARVIIEKHENTLYVNTPKNKELTNSQLRILKDYCIEHKLKLKQGNREIELEEGVGGNPETDKAYVTGDRWRVKWGNAKKTPLMREGKLGMFPYKFWLDNTGHIHQTDDHDTYVLNYFKMESGNEAYDKALTNKWYRGQTTGDTVFLVGLHPDFNKSQRTAIEDLFMTDLEIKYVVFVNDVSSGHGRTKIILSRTETLNENMFPKEYGQMNREFREGINTKLPWNIDYTKLPVETFASNPYWISPNNKVYDAGESHAWFAKEYLYPDLDYVPARQEALKNGWIRIRTHPTEGILEVEGNKLNSEQKKIIKELSKLQNLKPIAASKLQEIELEEGFGGNPDTDKAYDKGDRWRVKWDNAKKTPLMKESISQGLFKWFKQQLPTWPDYVINDIFVVKLKSRKEVEEKREHMNFIKKKYPNMKWELKVLEVTFDIFDRDTQNALKKRDGGKCNPNQVPNDVARHAVQSNLLKSRGVSKEPLIMIKNGNSYSLWEGWHRTIQNLNQFPNGYKCNAWIGIP